MNNAGAMSRHLSHVEEEEPLNSHASTLKQAETFHPTADFSSDEHLSGLHRKQYYEQRNIQSSSVKNVEMRQLHSITDLSSDEQMAGSMSYKQKVDEEIERLKEQLQETPKKSNPIAADSSHNSTLIMDLPNTSDLNNTPRGYNVILAQQIDQEISELRNLFEDHREEMLSVINAEEKVPEIPAAVLTSNVGCSPIMFDNPIKTRSHPNSSSPRRSRMKKMIPNFSDSEDSRDVQEERRIEFERFRQLRKQKRNQQPQFAIGQPISSANISSLFPKVQDQDTPGRHVSCCKNIVISQIFFLHFVNLQVPTVDGEQVFIPRLNLDDQWSIEDPQLKSLEQKVDKSCQTVEMIKQHSAIKIQKPFDKKLRKHKSKVIMVSHSVSKDKLVKLFLTPNFFHQELITLLETLRTANDIATKMKERSEDLLNELESEMNVLSKND